MKLILSRKGFDSANGGVPSPIFPDGTIVSLPIPTSDSPKTFGDMKISVDGDHISKIISDLTLDIVKHDSYAHIDPDINREAIECRQIDWRGAFGQLGSAQGHLANMGVGAGDIFIYFGWFREVEKNGTKWSFKPNSKNLHVIYGWLLVDKLLSVKRNKNNILAEYPWLADHPHLHGDDSDDDFVYIAGNSTPSKILPASGSGVFHKIKDSLILTDRTQNNRSVWQLPSAFYPSENKTALSYHSSNSRWTLKDNGLCTLRTVGRGQEFILDMDSYPGVQEWIFSLFD